MGVPIHVVVLRYVYLRINVVWKYTHLHITCFLLVGFFVIAAKEMVGCLFYTLCVISKPSCCVSPFNSSKNTYIHVHVRTVIDGRTVTNTQTRRKCTCTCTCIEFLHCDHAHIGWTTPLFPDVTDVVRYMYMCVLYRERFMNTGIMPEVSFRKAKRDVHVCTCTSGSILISSERR